MKKIIIMLIPFLLTGCARVTYDLKIEKDMKVVENVNMSATKEYFDNYYMNLPITIIKRAYENDVTMSYLKNNNYFVELREYNYPFPSIFASKKYNSLEEYVTNTVYKGQSFEEIFVEQNDDLVTLKTKNFIKYLPDDSNGDIDYRFPISKLSVNITLPFVVNESNADKIEKSTNTYIWYINEDTEEKEINITFDKNKIYIYNFSLYISIIVIIIVTTVLVIYVVKTVTKNKKNNSLR